MSDNSQSKFLLPDGVSDAAIPRKNIQDKYLLVTSAVKIPLHEIQFEYSHASGPGGQHVNTTDSAVLLRFHARSCQALSEEIRMRLQKIARRKMNARGELLITASEFRSQKQNKKKALQNLKELLKQAARKPNRRKRTSVPAASKSQRLQGKKHQAEKRQNRTPPHVDE